MKDMQKDFSVSEIFKSSWQGFRQNVMLYVKLLVGALIVLIVLGFLSDRMQMVGSLLSLVVQTLLAIGFISISLRIAEGKKPQVSDFWGDFGRFLPYLGATILMWVLVGVGILLLVIPGLILVAALQLTPYLVVHKKMGPIAAMYKSVALTRGYRWKIWGVLLILVVINMLAVIPLGMGFVISVPLSMLVMANVYMVLDGMVGESEVFPKLDVNTRLTAEPL